MSNGSTEATLAALFTTARNTIYAGEKGSDEQPVLVSCGEPGVYQAFSIVAVGSETRIPITRPTMGPNRSRETFTEVDCVISVYRAGDQDQQQPANAEAMRLLRLFEAYFRTGDQTLGGACTDAWISNARLVPSIAWTRPQSNDPEIRPVATGRVATAFLTITARVRY